MTDIERRTLLIVADQDGRLRASHIGWELWKDSHQHPKRGEGSHGSNKFCRPAGKILNRLQRLGLVDAGTDGVGIVWSLTYAGKKTLL